MYLATLKSKSSCGMAGSLSRPVKKLRELNGDKNFQKAHSLLQQDAQTPPDRREPNINDLLTLTIVTKSVAAHEICQERIATVEEALEKSLGETGAIRKAAARGP
ncbi:exodeoxyribonuclease VII small subunit [Polaromonas sp.]|uniref:exodeoxyribonuclease VII small subunit n=1 Tax=Polaromonas sp. TaxID=1869339 RepID=UPI001836D48E|nr:exodeoxyribonuclease VII small subunit [Polaromonas sp.]NMM08478.1 hypothetical protein [Polaromonas sp.]